MSVRAPAGAMGKTAYNVVLGRGVAAIKGNEFIFQTLVKMDLDGYWKKLAAGSTFESINSDTISNAVMSIPQQVEEQSKIGDLFESVDNLITLHQRKYEKFVNIKKALLEKMFPQGDEKVPRIRFKGFTDAWEQRKVQDVADRYDNLRIPVAANLRVSGNIPYYGANGIQDYVNGFTHEGEFVLVAEDGANDLKNYPVQHVQGRIWVNNHAHVLQGKPALMNNLFLAYSLHRADIASFLVGGSRAKLNADTLMTLELSLPSVEEQTKIGRNLAAVDNLITLHQRKQNGLFLLILGKKSSLILANDWEQRKLGDIGRVAMNRRIFKEQTSAEGSVPFYKIGTFGGEPDAFISDELYQEYKERFPYPKVGDILLSASGSIGKMVEYKGEKAYFQDSNIVWLDHDASVLNVFLKCFYSVVKWAGLEGSTIKRLYNKNILETQIALPSSAEQCLIGDFFEHIDNLITLHQCKEILIHNEYDSSSLFRSQYKMANAWEQRKLSEIVSYTASALSAKDVSDSGCYDLYDANSVIGKTNDGVMDHEYITIIKDGAGVGRVRILPAKTAFIGTMGAMTAKNSSLSFVYAMLCSTDLSKRFSGSTIPHIYFKDYGQEQYCVPELCEQDKIAAVFSDIDNLITLHQRGEKIYNRRQTW